MAKLDVHRLGDCVLVSGASYRHARKIDKSVFDRLTYSRFTDCNDRAMKWHRAYAANK